jgi:predicted NUDIX family phosphoesterase
VPHQRRFGTISQWAYADPVKMATRPWHPIEQRVSFFVREVLVNACGPEAREAHLSARAFILKPRELSFQLESLSVEESGRRGDGTGRRQKGWRCWSGLGASSPIERRETTDFLLGSDWVRRVLGVIAMSASPSDAMTREQGHLSVIGRQGSIMNTPVLSQMGEVLRETMDALRNSFRIFHVDTSSDEFSLKPKETCEAVASRILDWVEESVEEQILSVEKAEFPNLGDKFVTSASEAAEMIARFEEKGSFAPRRNVEADLTRIQPLPVVVVRNNSGQVLRLVRKESDSTSDLHKKITVWAGGHVRREDSPKGKGAISAGAIRELEEELRLFATSDQLRLLGAVYLNLEPTSRKHVAFVYEWRAQMDVVEVALCNSEFVEKGALPFRALSWLRNKLPQKPTWKPGLLRYLALY